MSWSLHRCILTWSLLFQQYLVDRSCHMSSCLFDAPPLLWGVTGFEIIAVVDISILKLRVNNNNNFVDLLLFCLIHAWARMLWFIPINSFFWSVLDLEFDFLNEEFSIVYIGCDHSPCDSLFPYVGSFKNVDVHWSSGCAYLHTIDIDHRFGIITFPQVNIHHDNMREVHSGRVSLVRDVYELLL